MIQCPIVLEFPSRFHSCLTFHIRLLSWPVDFTAPFISDLHFKSFCHRFFQIRIQFIEMQLTYSDIPHVIHVHSVFHTDLIRYKTLTMRYSKYSFVYATFVHMTYTLIQTFSSRNWVKYFTCMFLNHCQNPNNHITLGSLVFCSWISTCGQVFIQTDSLDRMQNLCNKSKWEKNSGGSITNLSLSNLLK